MFLTFWVCRFLQAALKPTSREKWYAALLKADTSWDWFSMEGLREVFSGLGA
jgi:hypothetical protein